MPWPQRRNTKNRPPREVTALTLTPTIDDSLTTTHKSSPTTALSSHSQTQSDAASAAATGAFPAAGGNSAPGAFTSHSDFSMPNPAWGEQTYVQTPMNGHHQSQSSNPHQLANRTQSITHTTSSSSADSTNQAVNGSVSSNNSNINNNGDLNTLERLKSEILAGQNPIYRAVPQPKFLESLYLGRASEGTTGNSDVPAHPDQVSDQNKNGRSLNDSTLEKARSNSTGVVHPGDSANKSDSRAQRNHLVKTERDSQEGARNPDGSVLKRDDREDARRDLSHQASQESTGSLSAKPTMILPDSRDSRYSGSQSAGSLGVTNSRDRVYDSRRNDYNRDIPPDDDNRAPRRDYRDSRYNDLRHYNHDIRDRGRERSRSRDKDRDRRIVDTRVDDRRIPEYLPPRERRPTVTEPRDTRAAQDNRRQDPRVIVDRMDVDRRSIPSTPPDRIIRPNDDPRAIPVDDRRDYPSRRENIPKNVEHGALPHTPVSMSSSPDKAAAERARPPPGSQDRRARSVDRPHEGAGDDRGRAIPYDDRPRQSAVDTASDRTVKPDPANLEERLSRPLENRISDRPHVPLEERIGAPSERSSSRPPALQERISDRPALEERIGNRPASALDDRKIPEETGPSLESRLSQQSGPATRERRASEAGARDEDRGRFVNDNRTDERRPATYGSGTAHNSPRPGPRPTHAPSPRPRDRDPRRISPGPPTSFRDERDARFADNRRTIDDGPGRYERPVPPRDRDIPPVIPSEDRARPSMEAREWRERGSFAPPPPPAGEPYSRDERYPAAPEPREWSGGSYRPPSSQWDGARDIPGPHDVGRARERYDEREPPRAVWEASQRDDRRVSGSIPPPHPPRSWDRADDALGGPRARESFPPASVDRGPPSADRNTERFVPKYPPSEYPPRDVGGGARVRPRSPSPIRRGVDDVRPPVKRVREEGYYDESRRIPGPPPTSAGYSDYPSRGGSPPPPPPPSSGSYYDSRSMPYSPRDPREVPPPQTYERRERPGTDRDIGGGGGYYDRRTDMPPPRSPPPYQSRAIYSRPDTRDDRRYSAPPPRTA